VPDDSEMGSSRLHPGGRDEAWTAHDRAPVRTGPGVFRG
jgi:hypothetical protein